MKFAVIESGGKQYLVSSGDKIQVEKLAGEKDSVIKFDKVLASFDDKSYELGKPYLDKGVVEGKVLKQGRGKKIEILKYKAKSKYRRKQGHRQAYTEVQITKV
jgi:large subunit ribosomal protein L21